MIRRQVRQVWCRRGRHISGGASLVAGAGQRRAWWHTKCPSFAPPPRAKFRRRRFEPEVKLPTQQLIKPGSGHPISMPSPLGPERATRSCFPRGVNIPTVKAFYRVLWHGACLVLRRHQAMQGDGFVQGGPTSAPAAWESWLRITTGTSTVVDRAGIEAGQQTFRTRSWLVSGCGGNCRKCRRPWIFDDSAKGRRFRGRPWAESRAPDRFCAWPSTIFAQLHPLRMRSASHFATLQRVLLPWWFSRHHLFPRFRCSLGLCPRPQDFHLGMLPWDSCCPVVPQTLSLQVGVYHAL